MKTLFNNPRLSTFFYFSSYFFFVIMLLITFGAQSQNSYFSLGGIEMLRSSDKPKPLLQKAAIGKFKYHGKVGGISFEEVALPDEGLDYTTISIDYNDNMPDGKRIEISFGGGSNEKYPLNLADWQTLPIAQFANDTNNAVVTVIDKVRYHPAFTDNLMGWRMLQADLLFLDKGTWDLPRDPFDTQKNETFLADSELGFRPDTSKKRYYEDLMDKLTEDLGGYNSYILTDWGKEVKFGLYNNSFYLTGEPYYLFTKNKKGYLPKIIDACNEFNKIQIKNKVQKYPQLCRFCANEKFDWQYQEIKDLINLALYDMEAYKDEIKENLVSLKSEVTMDEWQDIIEVIDNLKSITNVANFKKDLNLLLIYDFETYNNLITEEINRFDKGDSLKIKTTPLFSVLRNKPFTEESYDLVTDILDSIYYDSPTDSDLETLALRLLDITPPKFIDKINELNVEDFIREDSLSSEFNSIKRRLNSLKGYTRYTQLLKSSTESLELNAIKLYEYNPAIYDSATKVMRYSAFFRFIKEKYPENWDNFLEELDDAYPNLNIPKNWPKPAPSRPNDKVNDGFLTPTIW